MPQCPVSGNAVAFNLTSRNSGPKSSANVATRYNLYTLHVNAMQLKLVSPQRQLNSYLRPKSVRTFAKYLWKYFCKVISIAWLFLTSLIRFPLTHTTVCTHMRQISAHKSAFRRLISSAHNLIFGCGGISLSPAALSAAYRDAR